MSELPNSWTFTPLANLLTRIEAGLNVKCEERPPSPGERGLVKISAVTWGRFDELQSKTLPPSEHPDPDRKIQMGDLLLSRANTLELVGASVIVQQLTRDLYLSDKVLRLVVHEPSKRWINYALKTPALRKAIGEASSGNQLSMRNISQDSLRQLMLPLAPEREQQRIADKLDNVLTRVDAVNDRLARVAPLLKRFRQSVLAAATSGRLTEDWRLNASAKSASEELALYLQARSISEKKPPAQPDMTHWKSTVPSSWTVASVHQFAECLDRLRVPIKRDNRKSELGLYPYYGANGEVGRIDEYIFDDELVLVTEDETFYGREKPIAYRSSGKCWVNNHAHVLRAPTKEANDYLCYALMYYNVLPWLSGTTGRAKLTQQALNSLPIAVPPAAEITEIVRRVETLFAFADRLEARLQAAQTATERLTPSLLAKAFRGELVPQDPNEEPASELLQRLASQTGGSSRTRGRTKRAATA
ncbi:restriction endonuclease subunit S [Aquimonas sp.]|jgi:type I restriction enzyme S subunit|uniref:restriction endonuclease subunit S n=1 Tax=Aquimonas sp. TaxID=1872588 RepID=UPI0037C081C2